MDNVIIIGNDVTVWADVIICISSHKYKELGTPIDQKGENFTGK